MRFYADLHIHSKYSRATSRDCDLENLAFWGRKKGITVIGTGDFTHPAWFKELTEKLVPAEPGLYRLRDDLESEVLRRLPSACYGTTRFMLSVEISTIYKKGDKTRKVHHLIYAPTLEQAGMINQKLGKIGNIRSDGRPILGLDSRHLLEIVLSAGEGCYLVPAHIWTPWFSVLGSKSGFDRVDDCYADLAKHVFAVETGLSSDPEMNWRISHLDRYRLMSNSDAHSPQKLGREACLFETDLDYFAMRRALETGKGYGGTAEFFPEEGKYHMDGHRNCNVRLTPEESRAHGGLCPVCKKPLTLGVLYRVMELADRKEGYKPAEAAAFQSIIPLPEVISEIVHSGVSSQKVCQPYETLLSKLGDELSILNQVPVENIRREGSTLMAEAIGRMRAGQVIREAGYDGEYGRIRLFKDGELEKKMSVSVGVLFEIEQGKKEGGRSKVEGGRKKEKGEREKGKEIVGTLSSNLQLPTSNSPSSVFSRPSRLKTHDPSLSTGLSYGILSALDPDQRKAAEILSGPVMILAGPGSGKTRTLTHRIAHLVTSGTASAGHCLAITFTRRARDEMLGRLKKLLGRKTQEVSILTFHGIGLQILEENREAAGLPRGFRTADEKERKSFAVKALKWSEKKTQTAMRRLALLKRQGLKPQPQSDEASLAALFEEWRDHEGWLDYEDLLLLPLKLLDENPTLAAAYRERYRWISVDEYQDIDALGYRLVRHLAPRDGNLCVIGDPDQAIYRFRGADVRFFMEFEKDFPLAHQIRLARNYRSGDSILSASSQMIAPASLTETQGMTPLIGDTGKVVIYQASTDRAEAEFVVESIEKILGGGSFFSVDSGRSSGAAEESFSFADFAVLTRTEAQADLLQEALERSGFPFRRFSHENPETEWDERADAIALLTLHASKGLEFSVVFITGCEDGLIPFFFGTKADPETLAEERRLFYVGMTRAKIRLFLSHAARRMQYGKVREQEISPFLKDVQENLLERKKSAPPNPRKSAQKTQLDLFA